jgi:hypothetical protein
MIQEQNDLIWLLVSPMIPSGRDIKGLWEVGKERVLLEMKGYCHQGDGDLLNHCPVVMI